MDDYLWEIRGNGLYKNSRAAHNPLGYVSIAPDAAQHHHVPAQNAYNLRVANYANIVNRHRYQ